MRQRSEVIDRVHATLRELGFRRQQQLPTMKRPESRQRNCVSAVAPVTIVVDVPWMVRRTYSRDRVLSRHK